MASSLHFTLAPTTIISRKSFNTRNYVTRIRCIGWDPEGILAAPQGGHIARLEFKKRLEKDSEARDAFQRQVQEEKERLQAYRESRVIPTAAEGLVEYFLDTEAQEIEFEIARLRPRLDKEFFSYMKLELGKLKFSVSNSQVIDDRIVELETLQRALQEAIEAYDNMQSDIITARKNLTKILTSNDVKATLLDMVEQNELNRSLLTLLDENIANAYQSNQNQAGEYMEKLRGAVLKYITV